MTCALFVLPGKLSPGNKQKARTCAAQMSLRLHSRPPVESRLVVDFVRRETGWYVADGEVEHCISIGECTFATVDDDLAAMALGIPNGDEASTLAYVVTGTAHRRMGLGRRVVRDILQRVGKDVRLIASAMGEPLYHQLNFVRVPNWQVAFLVRQHSTGSPGCGEGKELEPASDILEEAAREKFGYSSKTTVPASGRKCFVLENEGLIYGAVWVYPMYKIDRSTPGAWIGPVYGTTDTHATDVVVGSLAWWIARHGACEFNALVPSSKPNGISVELFVKCGFEFPQFRLPTMRRTDDSNTGMEDPPDRLHALSGWTCP